MRKNHSDGYTDIHYDDDGDFIVSSGADGEVKILSQIEDTNPIVHKLGDVVYAVAIKNERLYIANDMNAIQSYTIIDGMNDGVMLRFTAPSHHFLFNETGNFLLAGSSDSTLRSLNLETKIQKLYEGHEAAVLSVALHSNENISASSSCDGCVRVWDLKAQKCLKVINCLPKSNSFKNSKTNARLVFCNSMESLIIPCEQSLKFLSLQSWDVILEITKPFMDEIVTMVSLSHDEKHLVTTTKTQLYIFNTETNKIVKSEKVRASITGISWHPKSKNLVFSDERGQISLLPMVINDNNNFSKLLQSTDFFADNDDDLILSGMNDDALIDSNLTNKGNYQKINGNEAILKLDSNDIEKQVLSKLILIGNESKNNAFSKIKSMDDRDSISNDVASIDDLIEEGSDIGRIPGIDTDGEEDDEDDLKPGGKKDPPMVFNDEVSNDRLLLDNVNVLPTVYKPSWAPTPLQDPFQPSATPFSYSRFMLWNEIGRIIQYDNEEEQSINVEFHDSSVHHAIHINNSVHNYTIAALNIHALVLASPALADVPSKLFCMHFSSWEVTKEWTLSLCMNEEFICVDVGEGWIVTATSQHNIRLFSYSGIQKEIWSIPGPIVCVIAQLDMLIIVYHSALAIVGDQCLSYEFKSIIKKQEINSSRLPISSKSTLKWIGFSSEGTPFSVDSLGIIRIYNRNFAHTWTPVTNLNNHVKSPSDSYWVVSIREEPQQIRAIFCKGSKYPQVLPQPTIQILPFIVPLCEPTTEKSILEENYWRSVLFSQHFNFWKDEDYDYDEEVEEKALNIQQEYLMKLFALACRSKKEYRAIEVGELLPTSRAVQLACKYAIQRGAMHIADKLEEVVTSKSDKENYEQQECSKSLNMKKMNGNVSIDETILDEQEDSNTEQLQKCDQTNAILRWKPKDENSKPISNISLSTSQTSRLNKNPFKVFGAGSKSTGHIGSLIFDSFEIPKKSLRAPHVETLMPKKVNFGQKKLSSTNITKNINDQEMSGFEKWYTENKCKIADENPDSTDDELVIIAAKIFKSLDKSIQKEYQNCQKSNILKPVEKKRKSENENSTLNKDKKLKNI